jgi:uncharacterized membrane protein YedE/YeeE
MTAAMATLLFGLMIGYLGQRSRLCMVSGYRDLVLMRAGVSLTGVFGVFLGAAVGYSVFSLTGGNLPAYPMWDSETQSSLFVPIMSAFGFGVVALLAGGCPFRMHILAGEGNASCWLYLIGFYLGLIFFNIWTGPVLGPFAE